MHKFDVYQEKKQSVWLLSEVCSFCECLYFIKIFVITGSVLH